MAFATTGTAGPRATQATPRVNVVATEFKFKLSKKTVPVGKVTFTVVNKGKLAHDFKIAGKKTPLIKPGKKATLTVAFKKAGKYGYICTVPGHAAAGMKGVLTVGGANANTPTTTGTTGTTTTTTPPVGGANTTVTVGMYEYRFDLSQSTVPSGRVTFVITNRGSEVHNFDITGIKAGSIIGPGQSETWTVALPPGTYEYLCDVPFHAERGMVGQLTVTG
jgi:nitrite reductase (NO-forming)